MKLPLFPDESRCGLYNILGLLSGTETALHTSWAFNCEREFDFGLRHTSRDVFDLKAFIRLLPKDIKIHATENEIFFAIGDSVVSFYGERTGSFKEQNEVLEITGVCSRDDWGSEREGIENDPNRRNTPAYLRVAQSVFDA